MYTAGELGGATPPTVFNGSQPQATTGTVDPSGYVDRELNKPSQTRSGLAAAMLRRAGGSPAQHQPRAPHIPSHRVAPVRTPQGHIVNQNRNPGVQGTPVGNHPLAPKPMAPSTPFVAQPHVATLASTGAPNTTQQLSQPTPITQVPGQPAGQIPLDPSIANLIAQQQASESQFEGQHQQALNDALARGTEQQGLIHHQQPFQEAAINSGFGGRGMFESSGVPLAQTQLHDSIARKLADIQQQETLDQRNYGEAVASGQTRLADQIAADYQKNAQLADQQSSTMDLNAVNPNGNVDVNQLLRDIFGGDTNALNLAQNGSAQKLPALPATTPVKATSTRTAPKKAPSGSAGRLTAKGAHHPSQKKGKK